MNQRCGRVFWMVAAMMLPLKFAWAGDECGAEAAGQDIVNCNAAAYSSGVEYLNSDGVDLFFNNPLTAVSNSSAGIKVVGTGAGHVGVRVGSLATLTTTDASAHGIFVQQTGDGIARIRVDAGAIETQGQGASALGLLAETTNASNTEKVKVTLNGGSVESQSYQGIRAVTSGLGDVTIQMNGGTVLAGNGVGLEPEIKNTSSTATVSAIMTGGTVTTATTSAGARQGIYITHRGAGGQAIVTLQNDSKIDANGGSQGVFLYLTNNAISYDINIEGTAEVKGKAGMFVRGTGTQTVGTIDIAAGALVDGTTYGGFDAVNGNDGDSTVTVAGTLKGRVKLAGGDDTLTLAASAPMADVGGLEGGMGMDTLVFNTTGSFSGSDVTDWETIQIGGTGNLAIDGTLNVTAGGSGLAVVGVLDLQDGATNDVVAVDGNYAGGGTIKLDTVLNNGVGGELSDTLTVTGATIGATTLDIANLGGTGAATGTGDTDGILVVSVDGVSGGNFVLASPLTVGGFAYNLHKSAGGDWYLQGTSSVCTPLGDANHDGNVNIQDVIEIINIVLAGGTGDECADVVVGDGINIQDVIGVINLILDN